eukprot:8945157-Pyramimonas_sp.AAC.1
MTVSSKVWVFDGCRRSSGAAINYQHFSAASSDTPGFARSPTFARRSSPGRKDPENAAST